MYDIKQNFTIVKLKSAERKIERLKKNGKPGEARLVEAEIKSENQEIIEAVNKHYTFSKYYFILGQDYHHLVERDYDGLTLYDSELNPIAGSIAKDVEFSVLSFEGVYSDVHIEIINGQRMPKGGNDWYAGIAMWDKDLIQYKKPFPQLGLPPFRYSQNSTASLTKQYNSQLTVWNQTHSGRIQRFAK